MKKLLVALVLALPTAPLVATEVAAKPLPQCSTVWQVGKTLPTEYAGCREGQRVVPSNSLSCAAPVGTLPCVERRTPETYRDLAAFPGKRIKPLA